MDGGDFPWSRHGSSGLAFPASWPADRAPPISRLSGLASPDHAQLGGMSAPELEATGSGWEHWTTSLASVPRGLTRGEDIAIFRTADDRVFALHDRCPHKQGKLSQGIVHGTSVTCPLHNWVIGLEDGMAKDPDEGCVRTVPVKLEDATSCWRSPS